ncbi:MAG: hypothetical protein ACI83O_000055 [Patescibacteria group bacterium]|jgi:hypothetical protein
MTDSTDGREKSVSCLGSDEEYRTAFPNGSGLWAGTPRKTHGPNQSASDQYVIYYLGSTGSQRQSLNTDLIGHLEGFGGVHPLKERTYESLSRYLSNSDVFIAEMSNPSSKDLVTMGVIMGSHQPLLVLSNTRTSSPPFYDNFTSSATFVKYGSKAEAKDKIDQFFAKL